MGVFQVSPPPPESSSSSLMRLFVGEGGLTIFSLGLLDLRPVEAATSASSLDMVELHSEATVRLDSGRSESKISKSLSLQQN